MHLVPGLAWEFSDDPPVPLDPRLLPLLRAVAQTGSLAAAVADRGLSYRAAWGLLRAYHRKLGSPLVVLEWMSRGFIFRWRRNMSGAVRSSCGRYDHGLIASSLLWTAIKV